MTRQVLIVAALLPLWLGLFACASREDLQAERVAKQAASEAEDDAAAAAELWREHRGVGGAVLLHPAQRLAGRRALHLVVVLAHDPFFAGYVGRSQHRPEGISERVRRCRPGICILKKIEPFELTFLGTLLIKFLGLIL